MKREAEREALSLYQIDSSRMISWAYMLRETQSAQARDTGAYKTKTRHQSLLVILNSFSEVEQLPPIVARLGARAATCPEHMKCGR